MNFFKQYKETFSRGLKVVLFFVVLIGIIALEWLALSVIISTGIIADPETWDPEQVLFFIIILEVPAALFVTFLFLRKNNLSFRNIGLALHKVWKRELWYGFLIGVGLIAFIFFFGLTFGILQTSWNGLSFGIIISHGGILLLLFGLQCAVEEFIFRGYPFQQCMAATNPAFSIILFSLLFGILHSINPNGTVLGVVNTMLAGVLLAVAFLRTHALWMSIGIHWGWNFSQGFLFSFPVSGSTFPPDLFSTIRTGPNWLSGSSFGPEGGLIASIVLIIATVVIYLTERIQPDESMKEGLAFSDS